MRGWQVYSLMFEWSEMQGLFLLGQSLLHSSAHIRQIPKQIRAAPQDRPL